MQGIVSGVNRELNTGLYTIKGVIQVDAAINPGNSGAPKTTVLCCVAAYTAVASPGPEVPDGKASPGGAHVQAARCHHANVLSP